VLAIHLLLVAARQLIDAHQLRIPKRPHEKRGLCAASTPFDEEGVATRSRAVVRDGVPSKLFARQLFGAQGRHEKHGRRGHQNLIVESNGPTSSPG